MCDHLMHTPHRITTDWSTNSCHIGVTGIIRLQIIQVEMTTGKMSYSFTYSSPSPVGHIELPPSFLIHGNMLSLPQVEFI